MEYQPCYVEERAGGGEGLERAGAESGVDCAAEEGDGADSEWGKSGLSEWCLAICLVCYHEGADGGRMEFHRLIVVLYLFPGRVPRIRSYVSHLKFWNHLRVSSLFSKDPCNLVCFNRARSCKARSNSYFGP